MIAVSEQDRVAGEETTTDGYTLLKLFAVYSFEAGGVLSAVNSRTRSRAPRPRKRAAMVPPRSSAGVRATARPMPSPLALGGAATKQLEDVPQVVRRGADARVCQRTVVFDADTSRCD